MEGNDELRKGKCYIDGVYSFVRKINVISETKTIVCYFKNMTSYCEDLKDFSKRSYKHYKFK